MFQAMVKNKMGLLIAMICLLFLLAACGSDSAATEDGAIQLPDALIGAWDNSEIPVSIVFYQDSTFEVFSNTESASGVYTVDAEAGSFIIIDSDGIKKEATVEDSIFYLQDFAGHFYAVDSPGYSPQAATGALDNISNNSTSDAGSQDAAASTAPATQDAPAAPTAPTQDAPAQNITGADSSSPNAPAAANNYSVLGSWDDHTNATSALFYDTGLLELHTADGMYQCSYNFDSATGNLEYMFAGSSSIDTGLMSAAGELALYIGNTTLNFSQVDQATYLYVVGINDYVNGWDNSELALSMVIHADSSYEIFQGDSYESGTITVIDLNNFTLHRSNGEVLSGTRDESVIYIDTFDGYFYGTSAPAYIPQ